MAKAVVPNACDRVASVAQRRWTWVGVLELQESKADPIIVQGGQGKSQDQIPLPLRSRCYAILASLVRDDKKIASFGVTK